MSDELVLAGLALVLLVLLVLAVLWVVLLRSSWQRPAGSLPQLEQALASLQELGRIQSQQVSELQRALQDMGTRTAQLETRTEAAERQQQALYQALQDGHSRLLGSLEQLSMTVTQLATRAGTSEAEQRTLRQAVQQLQTTLAEVQTKLGSLSQEQGSAASRLDSRLGQLQELVTQAQQALLLLQKREEDVVRRQEEVSEFIRRIDAVLTGSASRGAAGEQVLHVFFEQLPPDFKAFNLRIQNRVVEFAFRLPNGKYVPVDSKWIGGKELEQLASQADGDRELERRRLEQELLRRCDEVVAYLDQNLTLGLAIIAVPDAVYRWTQQVHTEVLGKGVIVIGYSMVIPYFLTLLHFAVRFLRGEETQRLSQSAHQLAQALTAIQAELEGRFAKGLTMLQNSRHEMAAQTSSALELVKEWQALGATGEQLLPLSEGDELVHE